MTRQAYKYNITNIPIKQLWAEISNRKKIQSGIIIVNTVSFGCKKHLISPQS